MTERRHHRRIPFARAVAVNRSDGRNCLLEAEDISLAGMRLFSERPLQVGETLELNFYVVPRGEVHSLNLQGEVRHVGLERSGYTVGVDFMDQT
ncbi:MAG: PilZ domain-containing protein [Proteobacteria bacterium]|jgi:hypothetical protein|nr:PilZ domain-containing protein [Pseudomonadota bacterium]MCG6935393.1 PilZ domain-containing protein [Pseudomonadota bacterium]